MVLKPEEFLFKVCKVMERTDYFAYIRTEFGWIGDSQQEPAVGCLVSRLTHVQSSCPSGVSMWPMNGAVDVLNRIVSGVPRNSEKDWSITVIHFDVLRTIDSCFICQLCPFVFVSL